jgi:hypothetical protein
MVERAIVMCNQKIIGRQHFPLVASAGESDIRGIPPIPGSSLEEIEK